MIMEQAARAALQIVATVSAFGVGGAIGAGVVFGFARFACWLKRQTA
jgi:hypothetical protein